MSIYTGDAAELKFGWIHVSIYRRGKTNEEVRDYWRRVSMAVEHLLLDEVSKDESV